MSPRNLFDEHYRFMWQFRLDGKTWSEGTDLFNAKFGKMSKGGTAYYDAKNLEARWDQGVKQGINQYGKGAYLKQLNEALAKTEHQRRSGPCKQAAQRPARQAYFQFLSESAARQRVENEETGVRPTGLQVLQKGLEEFRAHKAAQKNLKSDDESVESENDAEDEDDESENNEDDDNIESDDDDEELRWEDKEYVPKYKNKLQTSHNKHSDDEGLEEDSIVEDDSDVDKFSGNGAGIDSSTGSASSSFRTERAQRAVEKKHIQGKVQISQQDFNNDDVAALDAILG